MAKYSIQDTSLIAIGDAVRNKSGKHTRIEYVPQEVWIFKTDNVNSFEDVMNFNNTEKTGFKTDTEETITIPGATKLILKAVITSSYSDQRYELPEYSGTTWYRVGTIDRQLKEYEITGDTITIKVINTVMSMYKNAFYAEVRGYDEDGNLIKDENTLVEIEVKNTITPAKMATEIEELNTIPSEAFTITGNCQNRFGYGGWNWLIEQYGDKITTKDITNLESMFVNTSTLKSIPFDLNIADTVTAFNQVFGYCGIEVAPYIKGKLVTPTGNYSNNPSINNMFINCNWLRYIPDDFFDQFGGDEFWAAAQTFSGSRNGTFNGCYSLRKIPSSYVNLTNAQTSVYSHLYYNLFNTCYSVDEITNIPINTTVTFTSNMFQMTFQSLSRIHTILFETNEDGSPIAVNWKSQTIDLTPYVGYVYSQGSISNYNSGITFDTFVENDADYQALKDHPEMWTTKIEYARYNHDSAVATINSLPDTSAYLASAGGTNTIKFKGANGSLTDGGAINTLTEEEIAVAAAKGWTVSFA